MPEEMTGKPIRDEDLAAPTLVRLPSGVRDPLVDNARALLILSVVVGHLVMTYHDESPAIAYAHYFIYLFHMPAFALLSGYGITSPERTARRAMSALLPLYLGMSCVHLVMRFLFVGEWEWEIFVAPGLLWYILSLLCWRLTLPMLLRLRHPMLWAFAASILVGLTDRFGTTLSISRTIVFLPFFLLGYYVKRRHLDAIRRLPWLSAMAAVGVVAVVAWAAMEYHVIRLGLLAGSRPYSDIKGRTLFEMGGRIAVVACTLLVLIAVVRMLPSRETALTFVGRNSLTVYVLHMYYIYAVALWYPDLGTYTFADVLVLLSPFVVTVLLSTRPPRRLVDLVVGTTRRTLESLLRPI